ncbi:MAG: zinc ribbon domain-containing protein [Microcella sp.]|uniref:zinc ribbon domain-containing protein n=1 Tax=Microcella sp. TaxID=1913979 RepID=UPI0033156419
MVNCIACASPVREGARFCTRCGTAVAPRPEVEFVEDAPAPAVLEVAAAPREPSSAESVNPAPPMSPVRPAPSAASPAAHEPAIPARIPPPAPVAAAPFSRAAVGALLAGVAPLLVSVGGNALASLLGVQAVEAINAGRPDGAWAPFLTTLTLMFLVNAALLVLCGVLGLRALRQTRGGAMRGRPFALAGLATGAVNVVLWVVGLAVTLVRYSVILS